jgi:cobalamin biosynthesis protein CobT
MNGIKADIATNLLVSLAIELDNLRVPFEVMGFTTKEYAHGITNGVRSFPIIINMVKKFEESFKRVKHKFVWPTVSDATVEFPCIKYAAQRLALRKETKKILFILSDGETASGANDLNSALRVATKEYIERLTRAGMYVVGFGIIDYHITYYCKDHIIINSLGNFAKEFYAKLSQIILKS